MIEEIISALLRSQLGGLKRRTTGAILEAIAFALVGLAAIFVWVSFYAVLSKYMDAWKAALIPAALALVIAAIVFLIGRSMLRRNELRQREQIQAGLRGLGVLLRPSGSDRPETEGRSHTGTVLVVAALAAGVILGRSMKR